MRNARNAPLPLALGLLLLGSSASAQQPASPAPPPAPISTPATSSPAAPILQKAPPPAPRPVPVSPKPEAKAAPPPNPAVQKPEPKLPPRSIEPAPVGQIEGILGKKVWSAKGEDMGLIVDVLVDHNRVPRAAVIDFGGFLGVGSRKIAIDWQLVQFQPTDTKKPVLLSLGHAALQSAPEYKPGQAVEIVGAPSVPPPPPPLPPANGGK